MARQQELRQAQLKAKKRRQLIYGAVVVVLLGGVFYLVTRGGSSKKKVTTTGATTTVAGATTTVAGATTTVAGPTTTVVAPPTATPVAAGGTLTTWACPAFNGSSPHISKFPSTQPPLCINPAMTYTAHLTTSQGEVDFTLDTTKTPMTANNYIVLSLYHYYDGTAIDRIDTSIDIEQTGSPNTQSIDDPGPGYTIKDEGTGFTYAAGDVVMARGSGANSGSAQYFFVVGPNGAQLNSQGTYVTFGHVTTGLDVLQKIEGLYEPCPASDSTCLGGAPKIVVTISKVTITAA